MTAATAALLVAGLLSPGLAHAGYGVQPVGQTITVTASPLGAIVSPERIDFLVYLDERDSDAFVWVSDSPVIGPYGTPAGSTVGSCNSLGIRPWVEQGEHACSQNTSLLKPGKTYYWWLDYRRFEEGSTTPQKAISGPFAFAIAAVPASPTPAAPTPVATPPASAPTTRVSTKTYESAATLPTAKRYTGDRSIKHQWLTDVIYETMKALRLPRVLAIGCWSEFDFEAVATSADFVAHDDTTTLAGFWLGRQPRWLHLSPSVCGWIQGLLDTKQPTATRAFGLTVALHETLHAYGIVNEAQTNCLAVQLVPVAARFVGMTAQGGDRLRRLAINVTRRSAPPGYWNAGRCRDGGDWDLLPRVANLR